MVKPFDGLLGDTKELRILDFLLQMESFSFNITELEREADVSRPTATRIIRMFKERGIVKVERTEGRSAYYKINADSQFVHHIEGINNCLIESMLDENTLREVREHWQERSWRITHEAPPIAMALRDIITSRTEDEGKLGPIWGVGPTAEPVAAQRAPGSLVAGATGIGAAMHFANAV